MDNIETSAPFFSLSATEQDGVLALAALSTFFLTISAIIAKVWLRGLDIPVQRYDQALLIGTILLGIQTACAVHCAELGVGNHRDTISEHDIDNIMKYLYIIALLGIGINFCTKISMCLFIRRINTFSPIYTANNILMGLVAAIFVSSIFATAFPCLSPPWTTGTEAACPSVTTIYRYTILSSIVTDLLIVVLAAFMVSMVRTDIGAKILVTSLFSLRFACTATAIPALLDTSYLYNGGDADFTWSALYPLVWLILSWNFAVITACIPSLKGLFEAWLGHTFAMQFETSYELGESIVTSRPDAYTNINGSQGSKQLRSFRSKESLAREANRPNGRKRLDSGVASQMTRKTSSSAISRNPDPDVITDAEDGVVQHWQSDSVTKLTGRNSSGDCEDGRL